MHTLYRSYFSQTAYGNTFLVNDPYEIARATGNDKEWNSVKDSGCHFTCLAMIAGVDPAALASALVRSGNDKAAYFKPDTELPAKALSGVNCNLVWDQNLPDKRGSSVQTNPVWHPTLARTVKIKIKCVDVHRPKSASTSIEVAIGAISRGNHIVCGPDSHSVLVAGFGKKGPFVWDPDHKRQGLASMIAGNFALVDYAKSLGRGQIILHEYSCET